MVVCIASVSESWSPYDETRCCCYCLSTSVFQRLRLCRCRRQGERRWWRRESKYVGPMVCVHTTSPVTVKRQRRLSVTSFLVTERRTVRAPIEGDSVWNVPFNGLSLGMRALYTCRSWYLVHRPHPQTASRRPGRPNPKNKIQNCSPNQIFSLCSVAACFLCCYPCTCTPTTVTTREMACTRPSSHTSARE